VLPYLPEQQKKQRQQKSATRNGVTWVLHYGPAPSNAATTKTTTQKASHGRYTTYNAQHEMASGVALRTCSIKCRNFPRMRVNVVVSLFDRDCAKMSISSRKTSAGACLIAPRNAVM
jgi:hypothetical protein